MTKNIIIVGKPNVGKSSLFNALVKKNLALVNNTPRYTRDIKKKQFVLYINRYRYLYSKRAIKYLFTTIQSTTYLIYTVLCSVVMRLDFECQFL